MTASTHRQRLVEGGPIVLTVIAPCLNEEANIPALVNRTLKVFDVMGVAAELLLIDDGSSDGTWEAIREHGARDTRVRGVRHASNLGIEHAWRSGLGAARGESVCLIDADLQNQPEDIALLYETYMRGSDDIVQAVRHPISPLERSLLLTRGLNTLLNTVFHTRLRDNKSGFIICSHDVLTHTLEHRYHYRYFQSLIGVAARARGFTIGEMDTVFHHRHGGTSFLSRFPVLVSTRILVELMKFRVEVWLESRRSQTGRRRGWRIPTIQGKAVGSES